MAYRDEEDALRARNEALQDEVEQLKRERAAAEATHERQLREVRGAPALAPLPPRPAARAALLVGVVSVMLVALGTMFFVMSRGTRTPRVAPSPSQRASAVWHGRVKSAVGMSVAVGTACRLESNLHFPHRIVTAAARGASMKVTCGSETIYDSSDHSELGSSTLSFDDVATPLQANTYRFDLRYDEEGERSRRKPRATIDTARGVALFVRELPELRVELSIDSGSEPASASPD